MQAGPPSPFMFGIFMHRVSKCRRGLATVQLDDLKAVLSFADDVVLLALSRSSPPICSGAVCSVMVVRTAWGAAPVSLRAPASYPGQSGAASPLEMFNYLGFGLIWLFSFIFCGCFLQCSSTNIFSWTMEKSLKKWLCPWAPLSNL